MNSWKHSGYHFLWSNFISFSLWLTIVFRLAGFMVERWYIFSWGPDSAYPAMGFSTFFRRRARWIKYLLLVPAIYLCVFILMNKTEVGNDGVSGNKNGLPVIQGIGYGQPHVPKTAKPKPVYRRLVSFCAMLWMNNYYKNSVHSSNCFPSMMYLSALKIWVGSFLHVALTCSSDASRTMCILVSMTDPCCKWRTTVFSCQPRATFRVPPTILIN